LHDVWGSTGGTCRQSLGALGSKPPSGKKFENSEIFEKKCPSEKQKEFITFVFYLQCLLYGLGTDRTVIDLECFDLVNISVFAISE